MPNRLLLALARRPGVRSFITRRKLTRSVVDRFVAGETLEDGLRVAKELKAGGAKTILDYLGENVGSEEQADLAASAYLESLDRIATEAPNCHISIKLTQLGLDLSFENSLQRMGEITSRAEQVGTVVAIDMESHDYTDRTIEAYRQLRARHNNLVLCLQAYLKRTRNDVESLMSLDPKIRLCKGAYDEPDEIAFGRRQTRRVFREILEMLLANCSYTAVATHDDVLIKEATHIAKRRYLSGSSFEFQMLYGVRRELQDRLASEGHAMRVYVPFGEAWYAYLMRRLAERPANLRFFIEALARG